MHALKRSIVVGALIQKGHRILLAQRAGGRLDGLWEFPGGKVEPGESRKTALLREIREELGLSIAVGPLAARSDFRHGRVPCRLYCYHATILGGRLRLADHHAVKWVMPGSLAEYNLCPADIPIARQWASKAGFGAR